MKSEHEVNRICRSKIDERTRDLIIESIEFTRHEV